jgi:hypothetical protein
MANAMLNTAAAITSAVTNAGPSTINRTFRKRCRSGLSRPSGSTPRFEKSSAAQGASWTKWTNR